MAKRPKGFESSRKKQKVQDEEILSDEAEGSESLNDDFFETEETVEEKRIRLAKDVIKKIEEVAVDKEEVNELLGQTGLDTKGKLTLQVAKTLKPTYPATYHKGHLQGATCISVFPDSQRCITGSKDCCLIIWSIPSGSKLHIIKGFKHRRQGPSHFDEILCISISSDGSFFASSGKDRLIKLWRGTNYEFIKSLKGHRDTVTGLKFTANSHILFSCSTDRTVKVWDIDDLVNLDTLHGHYSSINDIDSYHNQRAITCGFDCSVRLWKTAEESQLVYNGHSFSIDCIRIVNADTFVTGGEDGNLCVWKTGKKKPSDIIEGAHAGCWICSLAVMRRTDIVASGSYDGWVNLYKIEGNKLTVVSKVNTNGGFITSLDFCANGKNLVASISNDHKLGRWSKGEKHKPGILVVPLDIEIKRY